MRLPASAFTSARAQMTGRHKKPIAQLLDEVGRAASALGDARCNPVVFHCTGTSMAEGLAGEAALVARAAKESGAQCFSVAQAILEALKAMGMRRVVLFQPLPAGYQRPREGVSAPSTASRWCATWRST